jgi:hypothetical protein
LRNTRNIPQFLCARPKRIRFQPECLIVKQKRYQTGKRSGDMRC